ncbi:hypothetical protein [Singulisphaera acidiphila]|uniref:hypothetical protein n=1 Tax=Singulisphaera acidiphila TaxID=466153 RepID=UPI0002471B46|nr:hypothetical protein [Singulisphaera acidiphila]
MRVPEWGGITLTKGENGAWVGTTHPLDEGFQYYRINIDGADVPDPGSKSYFGAGRSGSAIEIPTEDGDFYAVKDVPHGQLRHLSLRACEGLRRKSSVIFPSAVGLATDSPRIGREVEYAQPLSMNKPASISGGVEWRPCSSFHSRSSTPRRMDSALPPRSLVFIDLLNWQSLMHQIPDFGSG